MIGIKFNSKHFSPNKCRKYFIHFVIVACFVLSFISNYANVKMQSSDLIWRCDAMRLLYLENDFEMIRNSYTKCRVPKPNDFICFWIISVLDTERLSKMSERKKERQQNLISNENRMIGVLFERELIPYFCLFVCIRTHLTHLTTEINIWIAAKIHEADSALHNHTLSTACTLCILYMQHYLYIRNGNARTQAIIQRGYILIYIF